MSKNIADKDEKFSIANEFTGVWVQKVHTAQGERLVLNLPRTGGSISLDAMQLEALVQMSQSQLRELVTRSFENQDFSH